MLAALLPLAAMAAIALIALMAQQRDQAERASLEITRALATAVDGELRRSAAAAEILASSPLFDTEDPRALSDFVLRALAARPFWFAINIAEPSGRQVVNTQFPFGAPLPAIVDRPSFDAAVRDRKTTVGNLTKGPLGNFAFTVRVPVIRDEKLRFIVTVIVRPDAILDVVQRQRVPQDWVVSVFDAKNQRVARSRQHAETLGGLPSPSLLELMQRNEEEGVGVTAALEGERIYSAFSRLPSRWTVAIGIPPSLVEAGAWRSAGTFGGGLLLSAILGILAALLIGRRITTAIAALRDAAQALGAGRQPALPTTELQEIREAADALGAASAERDRGEAERGRLLVAEQEARATAEAANRAKDEFLAMLGHELRNPLGAISNATRLLEHPRTDAESARQAREIIGRQVDHLARMTEDLLDAGRAITGKIVLHRRPVDLAASVATTLGTLKPRTQDHALSQHLSEVWVNADPTRVEQIVANLVLNAVKYTPPGNSVRVSVAHEGAAAVLRVADDGIGMPPELTARVFELFVQGSRDLDRAHGGLGIGLTLVRQLAELHGGSAEASSGGQDHGSEFTVRLPAIARPSAAKVSPAPAIQAEPRDILIVEDNHDARETLRKLLEFSRHRVRAAADGEAGLAEVLASPPEVVLCDIGLPKMDGYEFARRVRAMPGGKPERPLLVAVTGYGTPEDRQRALDAGFNAHLIKPVNAESLNELLARG